MSNIEKKLDSSIIKVIHMKKDMQRWLVKLEAMNKDLLVARRESKEVIDHGQAKRK